MRTSRATVRGSATNSPFGASTACFVSSGVGVRRTFDIDHFKPVALPPEDVRAYDNLLYACGTCNATKGMRGVPDPTTVLLAPDVHVTEDGVIHSKTPEAARLIDLLGLDSPPFTEFRMLWPGILALAERFDPPLSVQLLGFPDDLPNLARLRPPGGNTRPEGVATSYFAQCANGLLPLMY